MTMLVRAHAVNVGDILTEGKVLAVRRAPGGMLTIVCKSVGMATYHLTCEPARMLFLVA